MPTRKRRRPVTRKPVPPPRRRGRRPGALTTIMVLAAAGTITYAALSVGDESTALVSERTVTVSRGVISTVVSGSGNLEPARQVDVNFDGTGKITKVYVVAGEHVGEGDLLARLDDRAAEVALAKAQADLTDAEAALADAQAAEASGTTTTTASTSGAPTQMITVAAQVTPTPSGTPGGGAAPRGGASPSATATATATPEATATPRATEQPEQSSPSSGQSVESAQAAVDSATLALEEAEDALDATRLRAPIAGTVASVSLGAGDQAGTGDAAFIVLAQLSKLKLEVALSESDIGKVEAGQSATVAVNAASGEDVAGRVTDVGVLASSDSADTGAGAVSYPVTITLDQTTDGLRSGMSATADIVVDRVTGLAVPSQALRGSTVTVERDGARSTQRVQTGVVGDSMTQVVSGLAEGDTVVVTSTSAIQGQAAAGAGPQQGTGFPGGGFGGGRAGAGGGFVPGGGGAIRPGGGGFGGGPPGGP